MLRLSRAVELDLQKGCGMICNFLIIQSIEQGNKVLVADMCFLINGLKLHATKVIGEKTILSKCTFQV